MNTPPLDYEPPDDQARRREPRVPGPVLLLGAWAGGVLAGRLACLAARPADLGAVAEFRAATLPSLAVAAALAVLFRRRLRRPSPAALLVALAVGLAPGAIALVRAVLKP